MTKGFFDTDLKAFAGFGERYETDNYGKYRFELFGMMFGNNGDSVHRMARPVVFSVVKNSNEWGMMVAQLIAFL